MSAPVISAESGDSILPCPFCGNPSPELIEVVTAKDHWRVGCRKCGSYNNISNNRNLALMMWNRRMPAFDAATSARDADNSDLKDVIAELNDVIAARDARIAQWDEGCKGLEILLKNRTKELTQGESQLAAALAMVQEQDKTILEKQQIIAEMQTFIDQLQNK